MAAEPVDLLVIGAGITGAGIARDAAMRGIRTALLDQGDFGSGTSSRSSRLVHGGLRYLEMGHLHLVFEASRERRTLLRIAPHLVWPRSFIFPIHAGGRIPRWKLAAGLTLYDLLALFRNVRRHRMLGKKQILRAEPNLLSRGLLGGGRYYDAQCDDAIGIAESAEARPTTLPLGMLKRLEVARALALNPKVLLLDEPLAGLNHLEAGRLADTVADLNAEGMTIVLIEHNLSEVVRVTGRLVVIDNGRKIAEGEPRRVMDDPAVRAAYLGQEADGAAA